LISAPQEIRQRLLKEKTIDCVRGCSRLRFLGSTPLLRTLTANLELAGKALVGVER
jgi:transposase